MNGILFSSSDIALMKVWFFFVVSGGLSNNRLKEPSWSISDWFGFTFIDLVVARGVIDEECFF